MSKKQSCDSTSYTGGFKITRLPDGTFVATKDNTQLKAGSAQEINEKIKNFNQTNPPNKKADSEGCCP
jgi:hypothetical protein